MSDKDPALTATLDQDLAKLTDTVTQLVAAARMALSDHDVHEVVRTLLASIEIGWSADECALGLTVAIVMLARAES